MGAKQSGQQGTRNGSRVSSSRTSLPSTVAQRSTTVGSHRNESLARSRDMTAKSGPGPWERSRRSRSVMEATMMARLRPTL